jgi:hypothetical protein
MLKASVVMKHLSPELLKKEYAGIQNTPTASGITITQACDNIPFYIA